MRWRVDGGWNVLALSQVNVSGGSNILPSVAKSSLTKRGSARRVGASRCRIACERKARENGGAGGEVFASEVKK